MHGNLPIAADAAISLAPGTGIVPVPEPGPNPGTGTDGEDGWFYDVAIAVFGKKETGWHLHNATGWPRTSCYAFVARDPDQRRKLHPEFLRRLFRSDHGEPFLLAFMAGSEARWWREHERARRIAGALSKVE